MIDATPPKRQLSTRTLSTAQDGNGVSAALSYQAGAELFFDSCGGLDRQGTPLRLVLTVTDREGRDPTQTLQFSQPVVLIGRGENCDVTLPHEEVSRQHAYLQMIDGRWMCVDLDSELGVRWPDGRQRSRWLEPNIPIEIGPYRISTTTGVADTPEPPRRRTKLKRKDCPEVHLQFLNGKCEDASLSGWTVRHRITMIGSSSVCELKLGDRSVSKVHASLVLTARGLWIVNLVGDDLIRVDGNPIRWRRLETGNELCIGQYRFRVKYMSFPPDWVPRTAQPRIETVQQNSEAVPVSATSGLSEEFVLGLMSQMAAMQQQFLEHSQQQMLLTAQLVSSLRLPESAIEDELRRVSQLTLELQQLRNQLAVQPATPLTALNASLPNAQVPIAPVVSEGGTAVNQDPTTRDAVQVESNPSQVSRDVSDKSGVQPTAAASEPPSQIEAPATRRTHEAVEMHATIFERMAVLERERSSHWSKIIGAITGRRS